MNSYILNHKLLIIGIVIGAIAGWLYWSFIGCNTGSCAITSNPANSTIYGAVLGGLFLSMFQKNEK